MTPVKVGFVLLSNSTNPMPSTRIVALNMIPFLRAAGFNPSIVFEPESPSEKPEVAGLSSRLIAERFEIIILQKVHGPSVERMTRELSAAGVRTVYCVCDLANSAMADAADATVVVTDYLKSLYPVHLHSKIHVVHDGIEDSDVCKSSWSDHRGSPSRPLNAVLVTSSPLICIPKIGIPPAWLNVTIVGRYAMRQPIKTRLRSALRTLVYLPNASERFNCFRFMMSSRIHCIPWSAERVNEMLLRADIGIIPIDNREIQLPEMLPPVWKRKSENRLTLKMAAGLPVIATPIPSYEPIIDHGVNGYFATSRFDWSKCLDVLRDPEIRQRVGHSARAAVIEKYSMEEQSRQLIKILREILPRPITETQES